MGTDEIGLFTSTMTAETLMEMYNTLQVHPELWSKLTGLKLENHISLISL